MPLRQNSVGFADFESTTCARKARTFQLRHAGFLYWAKQLVFLSVRRQPAVVLLSRNRGRLGLRRPVVEEQKEKRRKKEKWVELRYNFFSDLYWLLKVANCDDKPSSEAILTR